MHEGDAPTAGPAARHVVDEAIARRPTPLERPIEVRHAVADVMDPRPAPGEKLRHRAVRVARLEELDLDVAEGEPDDRGAVGRSEEHTSELQSPCNLVCRLLLEKKKKQNTTITVY